MYFQKSEVTGKTALVTGAGKGIGKATAIALAEAGADLIILSRTKSDLEKVKKQIIGRCLTTRRAPRAVSSTRRRSAA